MNRLMDIFKIKYVYYEREWPERCPRRREICWWRKGEPGEYWYKAENYFGGHTLGDTVNEACDECIDYLPVYWWGFIWFWTCELATRLQEQAKSRRVS